MFSGPEEILLCAWRVFDFFTWPIDQDMLLLHTCLQQVNLISSRWPAVGQPALGCQFDDEEDKAVMSKHVWQACNKSRLSVIVIVLSLFRPFNSLQQKKATP